MFFSTCLICSHLAKFFMIFVFFSRFPMILLFLLSQSHLLSINSNYNFYSCFTIMTVTSIVLLWALRIHGSLSYTQDFRECL